MLTLMAVSYTHLDSRLVNFTVKGAGHYRAAANGDATSLDLFHLPKMPAFSGQSVSYTHLDVYKRQALVGYEERSFFLWCELYLTLCTCLPGDGLSGSGS